MPKILIIEACKHCYPNFEIDIHPFQYFCKRMKREIEEPAEIPSWCPLEEEDNKLRAKWFKKGQMSVKRKNKSGCTCIIDEDLGDKVVSVCGAHQTWMEEQLSDAEGIE